MDYFKQLNDLRNELQRKIIYKTILAADPGSDYYLELEDHLEASYTIRSRETGRLETTQVNITGLDGTTGEMFAETAHGTPKRLNYHDLSLEQLATLLKKLETNSFTITLKHNDRNLVTIS